jgi:hypothetical protein
MLTRILKILHEIGAIGVAGSFAACIVLIAKTPTPSLIAYAAMRQGIAAIAQWLLLPSLGLVLISGLLAIAATNAYKNAAWAWVHQRFRGYAIDHQRERAACGGSRGARRVRPWRCRPTGRSAAHGMGWFVAAPGAVGGERRLGRVAAADLRAAALATVHRQLLKPSIT